MEYNSTKATSGGAFHIFKDPVQPNGITKKEMGDVTIVDPSGTPSGIIILLSDPAATEPIPAESSRAMAETGQIVALVDTGRYLAACESADDRCIRASDDLAGLKSIMLQGGHLPFGGPVILVESGARGALAYGACPIVSGAVHRRGGLWVQTRTARGWGRHKLITLP